jgi:hypothetical protein
MSGENTTTIEIETVRTPEKAQALGLSQPSEQKKARKRRPLSDEQKAKKKAARQAARLKARQGKIEEAAKSAAEQTDVKGRGKKGPKGVRKAMASHWNGQAFTKVRPGVVATVLELLAKASRSKPVTKEDVVVELATRFPDRDIDKMRATVSTFPTWTRSEKKCVVDSQRLEGGRFGYWIDKEATAAMLAEVGE